MVDFNIMPLIPELFLVLTAMGFLIVGAYQGNRACSVLSWSACISLFIAAALLMRTPWDTGPAFGGMFVLDQFAGFMKLMILIGLSFSTALSVQYLHQERIARFEYPVLVLIAGVGMMMMVSANNLLSLYMALELQSLSLYILAAFYRSSSRSAEAAIKYFILGALSSGMLLFGISLIYGFTGTLDFKAIQDAVSGMENIPAGFTVGMVFVLAALAFKISAVPFHMWTPDVYQGAPTSVTALFAIVPKIAAIGLIMRLLFVTFGPAQDQWIQVLYLVSLGSMFLGAFAALAQNNIKRLMAYSSIGNMGYALIGLIAGTSQGAGSVVVFLLIYLFMTAGVFAVILYMRRGGLATENINDLAGLSKNNPVIAYAMAALMFSMSGIPPAAGFFGKLFIFQAAVSSGLYILAVLGVLSSVVAAYYYLRIIKVMFFEEPAETFDDNMSFERRAVLAISIIFILGFAFEPNAVYDSAMNAVTSLF
ncbi:MAG: NADH-quinone oxidoreductase subunit NuoN [Alphaproteobacteria bacterium]|nr:NADH-quinone oxidoreductase subunit NuoN [Alphaproteobacteria bacterium]